MAKVCCGFGNREIFQDIKKELKSNNKDIKLYCVMPYMTRDINENHIYTSGLYYDDIIIPDTKGAK